MRRSTQDLYFGLVLVILGKIAAKMVLLMTMRGVSRSQYMEKRRTGVI